MKMSDVFASKYLKAIDLNGGEEGAQIDRVVMEEVGADKEEKPVLYFVGKQKGLVLNRTNSDRLVHRLGDDSKTWKGANVEIYSELVSYQGQKMEGIRLRVAKAAGGCGGAALNNAVPFGKA